MMTDDEAITLRIIADIVDGIRDRECSSGANRMYYPYIRLLRSLADRKSEAAKIAVELRGLIGFLHSHSGIGLAQVSRAILFLDTGTVTPTGTNTTKDNGTDKC